MKLRRSARAKTNNARTRQIDTCIYSRLSTELFSAPYDLLPQVQRQHFILNEKKSHVRDISPNKRVENVSVMCHNVEIPRVTEAKYLGVVLDEGLSWKTLVSAKSLAAVRSIGALRRNSKFVQPPHWIAAASQLAAVSNYYLTEF